MRIDFYIFSLTRFLGCWRQMGYYYGKRPVGRGVKRKLAHARTQGHRIARRFLFAIIPLKIIIVFYACLVACFLSDRCGGRGEYDV